jgi:hypothetical protein
MWNELQSLAYDTHVWIEKRHSRANDFNKRSATLWDGGEGAISLSDIPILARAVSAVLKQPDRVLDHRVKVHGGTITQN